MRPNPLFSYKCNRYFCYVQLILCSAAYSFSFLRPRLTASSVQTAMTSTTDNNFRIEIRPLPTLPIPPPILSLTPGTWAHDTMSRRIDSEILERTYQENKEEFHSPPFVQALARFNDLRKEMQSAGSTPLRHLLPSIHKDEKINPKLLEERTAWKHILSPYIDKTHVSDGHSSFEADTWLSAPWLVTEFYFYRRLLETLDYFNPESPTYLYDPFAKQKRAGLISSVKSADHVLEKINTLFSSFRDDDTTREKDVLFRKGVALASAFALWGNKMDLSLWPADVSSATVDVFADVLESATENLLHDDTLLLTQHCEEIRDKYKELDGGRVDIIVDNAGFELVMDLALADYLVSSNVARVVTFQLKAHPTFVSDAMEKDLQETVDYYASLDHAIYPNAKKAGKRWRQYLNEGRWKCNEDFFWVQGTAMWDMPSNLRDDLSERCDLAIVKGDANYRRLLGDRSWDFSSPFQEVVGNYFPCPLCALRTLKSEVGCGMNVDQVVKAKTIDKNWLVNGRFGVVHFGSGVQRSENTLWESTRSLSEKYSS